MSDQAASKRRYKLIAIDLDGTLLSPLGQVTPRTKSAVHRCLQAGLLVCFATGRSLTESETILDAIAHYDSAVFVGGAMVIDTKQRVTLHRVLMDAQLAADVCDVLESAGFGAVAAQDPGAAGCDYLVSGDVKLDHAMSSWLDASRCTVRTAPRLGGAPNLHQHTIRVSFVAKPADLDHVQRLLDDRFGERLFYHRIIVPHTGVELLEMFDPSVNKWEGILQVARRHGISPDEIIAIGDDMNDLHMVREAGMGVAMGNARDELKAVAKRVISDNREDGLAVFLEELLESHQVEQADGSEAAA
jgi:Cof subfamily protein (haloacid dehalogenase superfamily)